MKCKICLFRAEPLFVTTVLKKHDVSYYRCARCGFIATESPYWLDESYNSAINDIDIGPINRALSSVGLAEGMILSCFERDASFVDYGGGYGVFVRLMRDRGFDFYWHDRYCDNLFAQHFVARAGLQYEMATAYEVFEHFVDPLAEIEKILSYSRNILFSTLLVPANVRAASDWWYFSPEHGQHISFYTVQSLRFIAQHYDLRLYTDGVGNHLLSEKAVSSNLFRVFAGGTKVSWLLRRLLRRRMRRRSLLVDDFNRISGSGGKL